MSPGKMHYGGRLGGGKSQPPPVTAAFLKRIGAYLLPYRLQMGLATAAIVLAACLDVLPAVLTGRIIDEGFLGGDFQILLWLIAASFGVFLLSSLISVLQSHLNTWVGQSIIRDMRGQMYAHLQRMSMRFYTSSRQGEVLTRLTGDIAGVQTIISGTLANTLSNIAVLVTSIAAMYQKNWLLATAGVLIVPLFIIPTRSMGRKRWGLTTEVQRKNDEINQILSETLSVSGQQLMKLFTNEGKEYEKYTAANASMFRLKIREGLAGRWFRTTISTFTNMGPMLVYLAGGILMLRMGATDLTVGDISVMVALLTRMYRPVNALLEVHIDFVQAMALFHRIFEYLDMPVEIASQPDAKTLPDLRGDLCFSGVSFSYAPEKPVLRNISFGVPAGSTVALVGPSGAGKSTIAGLITRMYDVGEGCITLDGEDIRALDLEFLRGSVGVVTQDSYLFNATIRDNLLYARVDATEGELVKACREANIHDFIAGLPQGLDTLVGNRGMKLSGGERQRISIARAILKQPRLLILDEATSSLDSISESLIQQAIGPLLEQRTSLVIAHRLSTILEADNILVVEDGRIVEEGTHKQLLERDGIYRRLYETQFHQVLEER